MFKVSGIFFFLGKIEGFLCNLVGFLWTFGGFFSVES